LTKKLNTKSKVNINNYEYQTVTTSAVVEVPWERLVLYAVIWLDI